ncbi:hypothetical protein D3C78_1486390 [compost metagenome]
MQGAIRCQMRGLELLLARLQHDETDHHGDCADDQRGQPGLDHHCQGIDCRQQEDDEPRQNHHSPRCNGRRPGFQGSQVVLQLGLCQRQFLGEQLRYFAHQLAKQATDTDRVFVRRA